MAQTAAAVCWTNGASEQQVSIVPGQLEQLQALPEQQVRHAASREPERMTP